MSGKWPKVMKPLETAYWLRLGFGILAAVLSVGFLLIAGAVNTNLLSNPSVEIGNAGSATPKDWFSSGNGTEWSSTYARTGSRSLRIFVTNASAEWNTAAVPVQGGHTYDVNGYFLGQITANQFFLNVSWFSDSEGSLLLQEANISLPVTSYAQWTLEGGDLRSPAP